MIDVGLVGAELGELRHEYSWRDVVLYALGVGAKADELDFVYEARGPKVLPTFAVVPAFRVLAQTATRLGVDLLRIVHGEQQIRLHRPIPPAATAITKGRVAAIYDKGSGAVIVVEGTTREQGGAPLFDTVFSLFVRGAGGFGGERGPKSPDRAPPDGEPAFEWTERTSPEQHLLFRLNGDVNPIHASPKLAQLAGFERPILHGLCTYGYAGRAIVHRACGGDPTRLRSFAARFTGIVYPGDTLVTRGWRVARDRFVIRVVTERGTTVIDNSVAEIDA